MVSQLAYRKQLNPEELIGVRCACALRGSVRSFAPKSIKTNRTNVSISNGTFCSVWTMVLMRARAHKSVWQLLNDHGHWENMIDLNSNFVIIISAFFAFKFQSTENGNEWKHSLRCAPLAQWNIKLLSYHRCWLSKCPNSRLLPPTKQRWISNECFNTDKSSSLSQST